MQKIAVFTSTRAEYGLLYWLVKELDESEDFDLQLIVSGTHLSHEYGYTVADIIKDGFKPTECFANLIADDSPQAITRSSALLAMSLADYFAREKPDYFVVLGDRVELLAACEAAMIAKIPIVHLHGGEVTEGAVDDKVRHAITKLASLHFTSTEEYRRRVIQMGEHPDNVIRCGALGLESMNRQPILPRETLETTIGLPHGQKYMLVVYHPETNKDSENIEGLLRALQDYPDIVKVIIYPNSDAMSREIISAIKEFSAACPEQVILIKSLHRDIYLSLMKYCELYIGNSSSGIIEMPSFKRPIINIGDRQKGRIRSPATLDVPLDYQGIANAIHTALSDAYAAQLSAAENPYQGSSPSRTIITEFRKHGISGNLGKQFFDLEFKL
ncbi:UDP-N-acetylglucosamine 2-epimerase (hydrolyzing) [Pseudomonas daroniae]|uniref:UDP-N-acetylglucosamine 2-epimerase (Hydrolyzing) n=1 Tax=Phytopseudomonas daroniae TaxID=2487519 RepID=A0A4V2KB10_9GAMM|nr:MULTISPECIES: UDP-N-acetylglucosamine 2-epimerase [Pseudomonas]TBU81924.1 UDP-N-acetylglucosamine 2-epimerase (hydrolyzing) [Pseudomonas daroniae]TBU84739.1 UDP-N-acetylglucosamine 2-epimerase (hydrolyzing) [Pseudomonas sp. FRB 228]TBU92226.1 UDP-N-acetylglucosamine 2-epimerase (hydrolyzing) [Pseudomonas daroniae]